MDSTGYSQAVIHFAWFRDDHVRHLLFGMVELRPSEFPDALGSPEYTHRATSKGRKYLDRSPAPAQALRTTEQGQRTIVAS